MISMIKLLLISAISININVLFVESGCNECYNEDLFGGCDFDYICGVKWLFENIDDLVTKIDDLKVPTIEEIGQELGRKIVEVEPIKDVITFVDETIPEIAENFTKLLRDAFDDFTDIGNAIGLKIKFQSLFQAFGTNLPLIGDAFFKLLLEADIMPQGWYDFFPTMIELIENGFSNIQIPDIDMRRRMMKKRTLLSDDCITDDNDDTDLCIDAEAIYTEGVMYDWAAILQLRALNILPILQTPDELRSIYTDGEWYARYKFADTIMSVILDFAENRFCNTLSECTENPVKCPITTTCNLFVKILRTIKFFIENTLTVADMHDGLVAASQTQAILENQPLIIENQHRIYEYMDNKYDYLDENMDNNFTETNILITTKFNYLNETMNDMFTATNTLITIEFNNLHENIDSNFSVLTEFIDAEFETLTKNITDGLTETNSLITQKFDELTQFVQSNFDELRAENVNHFNLQNYWMNVKFDDLFYQLNTLDKLVRTPSGNRPGWNRQTDLDSLFINKSPIDIPQSGDTVPVFTSLSGITNVDDDKLSLQFINKKIKMNTKDILLITLAVCVGNMFIWIICGVFICAYTRKTKIIYDHV